MLLSIHNGEVNKDILKSVFLDVDKQNQRVGLKLILGVVIIHILSSILLAVDYPK